MQVSTKCSQSSKGGEVQWKLELWKSESIDTNYNRINALRLRETNFQVLYVENPILATEGLQKVV